MADHAASARRLDPGTDQERFHLSLECGGVEYASRSWGPEAPEPDEVRIWMEAEFGGHLSSCIGGEQ